MTHAGAPEVTVDDVEREDAGPEAPPPHAGPWSEADYRALSSPGIEARIEPRIEKALGEGRVELIDGTLVIGPGPTADAERAIARTRSALSEALPDGLCVVGPVPLRMGPDCVLVPDLVVMRAPSDDSDPEPDAVVDGQEVLMVVEVVGAEHGAVDRTFKPLVYARARLPYLLLVDREAPFASASMVISGRYHEYARAGGDDELELEEPFRLRLPLRDRG
jgi:Putative restriction endonuclease